MGQANDEPGPCLVTNRDGRAARAVLCDEIKRLKAELRRVTEERDILKKATAYFAKDHG